MTDLPKDPMMLLSVLNLKLRDFYPSLDALCEDLGADKAALTDALKAIDDEYDPEKDRLV